MAGRNSRSDKKTEARTEKYSREQDIRNTKKMREILDELPRFCRQYFRGIEESTSARTRLAYAYDLRVFFEFIENVIIIIQVAEYHDIHFLETLLDLVF